MALHNKLSKKPRTDLNTDLSDYAMASLPDPTEGPFECPEEHLEIYELDFFSISKLAKIHQKFRKQIISKIGAESFRKIELGLKSYVSSSKSENRDLLILKKSIIRWTPSLFYDFKSDLTQTDIQHLKPLEIENLTSNAYNNIKEIDLIPIIHLKEYQKLATIFSIKQLNEFAKHCKRKPSALIRSIEDISFYRGYNNKNYYNKGDRKSDIFSHYSSATEEQKEIFFERTIFTSYSICLGTAELFMVAFGSRRRALVQTGVNVVGHRIFSSFIVSPAFYKNQFEFLALPSARPLLIFHEYNNGDMSSFKILSSSVD